MLQGKERKDGKQEQNAGNGCTKRGQLTQLQIKMEMNYGGGAPGGERGRKSAAKNGIGPSALHFGCHKENVSTGSNGRHSTWSMARKV